MKIIYDVKKEKGTKRYFIYNTGSSTFHALETFDNKRKALHEAAKHEGTNYRDYMKKRRKAHAES